MNLHLRPKQQNLLQAIPVQPTLQPHQSHQPRQTHQVSM